MAANPTATNPTARRVVLATLLFFVVGNLAILVASLVARVTTRSTVLAVVGAPNARMVDERVVRGGAPTEAGYRSLAAIGVRTVVDLRAERDLDVPVGVLGDLGLERFHLPVRDGQPPSAEQVRQLVRIVGAAKGLVYVHCGAGVGRTGCTVAAYLASTSTRRGPSAVIANLAVGPPSLEQIAYVALLEPGREPRRPPLGIVAVSRVLDMPRRIRSRMRQRTAARRRAARA